tara:strand:+ start:312 stop:530 length:219 start_codon:yes stop_codon:yes gene_type:complete
MKNLSRKLSYTLYILLACVFISCTSKKEGEIVMDKEGNYYELTHKNAFMGDEMYRLEPIDTTKFKVKGFNAR